MDDAGAKVVHRWAVVTTVMTFLLILAGALVTSRDAGLAVPDWPLSFGTLNPPRWYAIENVRTEHGHRVIAGSVALATVLLGLLIRRRSNDTTVRRLGLLAVTLVLLQAALGGLRVLHLSVDLAMVHGWLGQAFFCVVVAIATMTSSTFRAVRSQSCVSPSTYRLACALLTAIVSQLVVGIIIRHEGAAARPLLESTLFYLHVALAASILLALLRLRVSIASLALPPVLRRVNALVALLCIQIGLGIGAFAVTETMAYDRQATWMESWLPTAHVGVGAAMLATTVSLLLLARVARQPVDLLVGGADLVEARR